MSGDTGGSISPGRLAWFARLLNRPAGRPEVLLADRIEAGADLEAAERAALAELVLLAVSAVYALDVCPAEHDEHTWAAGVWLPVEQHVRHGLFAADPSALVERSAAMARATWLLNQARQR